MKKAIFTTVLFLFSTGAQAGYLDFLDKDFWTLENVNKELTKLAFNHIKKKQKKENDDPNANMWEVNYSLLNDYYRYNSGISADIYSCKNKKFNKSPSSIFGANPPKIVNGVDTYVVARGMPYRLHQRDLSSRGIERLRDHYFSWVIPGEYIIHNPDDEDNDVSYVFNNLTYSKPLTVFNLAFAEEWFFELGWGGSFDDGSHNINGIPKFGFGGGKFLERYSCGYYNVNVVNNTAPVIADNVGFEIQMDGGGHLNRPIINFGVRASDRENSVLSGTYSLTLKNGKQIFGVGTGVNVYPLDQVGNLKSITVVVSDGRLSTTKTFDLTNLGR